MILVWLGIICLVLGIVLFFYGMFVLNNNLIQRQRHIEKPEFAILIPARYECAVIKGLFKSLKNQTIPVSPKSVFVIVESLKDPTVKIAKKFGYKIIVRDKIAGRERKGYALDEAIKQILTYRRFDLYFIFDADNILARDYLEQMLKDYAEGYEIATGYRDIKNKTPNVIATVSSLTFSMINTLSNRMRIKHDANVVFSGTGCFVDGKLIDKWQGWPFHSLTEDYELSLYATYHQLATFYDVQARFWDEQPTSFAQTFAQRVRWIRGYFEARKIYIPKMRKKLINYHNNTVEKEDCINVLIQSYSKNAAFGSMKREIIGVKPLILMVLGIVLILSGVLIRAFYAQGLIETLLLVGLVLLIVYIVLACVTIVIVWKEDLRLTFRQKLKAILFNPLYLISYIPCALKAMFAKQIKWTKIEHKE